MRGRYARIHRADRRGLSWVVVLAGTALALGAACGARTGLPLPVGGGKVTVQEPDGGTCEGTEAPLEVKVPNLYFVLDHSGSMVENGKWPDVRSVVADLIGRLGARASFGATIFPGAGNMCAAGAQVLPTGGDAVVLGDSNGATQQEFLTATDIVPSGGTPTAATLTALVPVLGPLHQPTFVILATDGGPNCDSHISCGPETCTTNIDNPPMGGCPNDGNCCAIVTDGGADTAGSLGCLDSAATVAAVQALQSAGVETFVIGIPGSAPYAALLDELAIAGGTARASEPHYYSVDNVGANGSDGGMAATLASTLADVAAQTMDSCSFTLTSQPPDPNQVNVYVGGSLVARGGPSGWLLSGAQLTLSGQLCDDVMAGQMLSLRVIEGCPTVVTN